MIDAFLSLIPNPLRADVEVERSAVLVLVMAGMTMVACAAFALFGWVQHGPSWMIAIATCSVVLAGMAPWVLARFRSTVVAGNWVAFVIWFQVTGEMALAGGLLAPAAVVCTLVVPAAVMAAGGWSGVFWTLLTSGSIVLTNLGVTAGVLPDPVLTGDSAAWQRALGLVAGLIGILVLVLLFEMQKRQALKELATERARYVHEATHDALTGLPNRTLFRVRFNDALEKARLEFSTCALFYMDLNDFKSINDQLGHHAGDVVLQELAHRLRRHVRESDTVARLSGDEFVLLSSRVTGRSDAEHVVARLRSLFNESFPVDDNRVEMTASVGYALFPDDADSADQLLRRADLVMYRQKANRPKLRVIPGNADA